MRPPIVLYEAPRRARTEYRIGLSSWTDKSMLDEGHFYPRKSMSPEGRLWWYSRFFDTVDVNSTFYALPAEETAAVWARRTPAGFLFNVKAYGLLTGHDVDLNRLPEPLRQALQAASAAVVPVRCPTAPSAPMRGCRRSGNCRRSSDRSRKPASLAIFCSSSLRG